MTFINFYSCPECPEKWANVYDAQPDDDCPKCGFRHVEPYHSEDLEFPEKTDQTKK